ILSLGALALLLAGVVLPGRALVSEGPAASAQRPSGTRDVPWNIVIIVMDTARQDRLSCYGHDRETSPRLTRLAESATVCLNAYSTSSWTGPGHASLFTGLHSVAHGVTQEDWSMDEDLVTFAEILTQHGYRTVGVVENPMLLSDRGYAQGFSEYYESWRTGTRSSSGQAVEDFRRALGGGAPGQPFLIFVNLIAPHSPYNSSRQFRNSFVTRPEIGVDSNMWRQYYTGRLSFSADQIQHLNELYDAELLYTDYLVGEMIDELVARNLWDDTVFIVTSDHGENIGDHAHMDHVFTLFETTTKIPLIAHQPELFPEGMTKDVPVQLTDIFPTVLEIAGVDVRDFPSHDYSLLGMAAPEDREIFTEYYYPTQVLSCYGREEHRQSPLLTPYLRRIRSLTSGDMKFVWGSDGRHELYDLARDPGELTNLADSGAHAELSRDMEARLTAWFQEFEHDEDSEPRGDNSEELDETTKEALRSLGYLE
ncbi:MAG: sulfatase, partial [Candidatus Eisenbacteria sp.]|nr:sulfatase [Candidatus Eisenbacteria bacterium]